MHTNVFGNVCVGVCFGEEHCKSQATKDQGIEVERKGK